MNNASQRVDTASRVIYAPVDDVFAALVSPEAWEIWMAPEGMRGRVEVFEPQQAGRFRFALFYLEATDENLGKSGDHADIINGRFVEVVPNSHVLQAIEFETDHAEFIGEMMMQWETASATDGTNVTVSAWNVPEGISPEDHQEGMDSSLQNLAAYLEGTDAK